MEITNQDELLLRAIIRDELKDVKHACIQEGVLGGVVNIQKRVVSELFGNGHEGLSRSFPRLENAVINLTTTVAAQTKVISDLLEFQSSLKGVNEYKEKEKLSARQRTQIIVSTILGFSAIITSIILKLL
jgi:hypothetical protein